MTMYQLFRSNQNRNKYYESVILKPVISLFYAVFTPTLVLILPSRLPAVYTKANTM